MGALGDEIGDELRWLIDLLDNAEGSSQLTQWEQEFCESMQERIEKWGSRTFVSSKQMEILNRIDEKLRR